MKFLYLFMGLLVPLIVVPAQESLFPWDLLWTGSWEESKNLHNRLDFRLGLGQTGLSARAQAIDRRPLLTASPWTDSSKAITNTALGLYHRETGSRLLYGILDEWGLPARIRSPWIRSAPFSENHKPIMADLRTTVSSTKEAQAYLYLSSPRLGFFEETSLPLNIRAFASAQLPSQSALEGDYAPAFSGGLHGLLGKKTELLLEGFYTSAELPARISSSWFSDPPPLPDRDFRLAAGALMLSAPYFSLSSDFAWSQTFAWGEGIYANAGLRLIPPPWTAWSLSLAADGMSERYVGRDGTSPGGGLRTAGKIEWKGPRSSLFRINTTLRGPALDEPFNRSASGIYYRFPALSAAAGRAASTANGGTFPLRISRLSLSFDRNATNMAKISDGIDGTLGLSLRLPPMSLPRSLLSASARKLKNPRPQIYPLGINLSASFDQLGSSGETPAPYPFFPANQGFDSAKTSCELSWSPGIFQFRTKWGYTVYAEKDNKLDGSLSAAVRFKYGRFSAKIAWPDFPENWNCTLSWRVTR